MINQVENCSGIYIILNTSNGKIYIGSGVKLNKRRREHSYELRKGIHDNKYLQNSFSKHSIECFQFYILERCDSLHLIEREQYYIDNLLPEYNMCKVAGNRLGLKHSEETKRKLSEVHKGRVWSTEQTQAFLEAMKLRRGTAKLPVGEKKVKQFTKEGIFVKEYQSVVKASKETGVGVYSIYHCCSGKYKTGRGFKWNYSDVK